MITNYLHSIVYSYCRIVVHTIDKYIQYTHIYIISGYLNDTFSLNFDTRFTYKVISKITKMG